MLVTKETSKQEVLKRSTGNCTGCNRCCHYGSGVAAPDDIPKIAKVLGLSQEETKEKYFEEIEKFNTILHRPKLLRKKDNDPHGQCIFLKDDKCSIDAVKPLMCKIGTCDVEAVDLLKWFDLNFFLNPKDPESVRQYALHLEFADPLPGATLGDIIPDKSVLKSILSYEFFR